VHNFASPPPGVDSYNRDFREALGLKNGGLFVLQPTRVIRRKGIEMAIEIVHRLQRPDAHLIITHRADDEGLNYWHWLQREAASMDVNLQLVDYLIGDERINTNNHKIFTIWDAYPHADLVTYPSTYEGFGNALLETIYFKRLTVINRYPVYNADIRPLGFEFLELDGYVDQLLIERTRQLLQDPAEVQRITNKNYNLAQEYFSYEVLERKLKEILHNF
jgi:glycosyltransferase involved in cell wall biosynthesis